MKRELPDFYVNVKKWKDIFVTRVSKSQCFEFYTFLLTEDPPGEFSIMLAPLPTPPWSVLLSQEQKCSGHPSILFFFGGGGVSILSEPGLEGSNLKLNIHCAFFLTFLSKIVE